MASLEDNLYLQLGLSGLSCLVAQTTVHWIETTMVRQQLAKESIGMMPMAAKIAREEGMSSLYRGYMATVFRELSYSSLRFGLYEPFKKMLGATNPKETPFYKKVMAGLSAAAVASAIASPTDLLKIRAQGETGPRRPFSRQVWEVATKDGATTSMLGMLGNLYRGVTTTITRASLIGATKMATYDECKTQLRKHFRWRDAVPTERYALQFCASFSAGLAICLASSPATNARTMIMASPPGTYSGLLDALVSIVKTRGPLGLYRGFLAQWTRIGPYALVQFFVWEQLRHLIGMRPL